MPASDPAPKSVARRAFLKTAAAAPVAVAAAQFARGQESNVETPGSLFPGVITRQTQPENVEFPFPALNSYLTPNEQFYIRNHFDVPAVSPTEWMLSVEGHVERPFEVSFDELRKLQATTVTALLECSGNSRVFLKPPQLGIRWEQGGVGNAIWRGTPLSALLDRAGVKPGAVEVILEGLDKGKFDSPLPKSPGEIQYARSLPLAKARQPEVLIAHQMNGEDLTPAHGFPARAVVAGWYGMASVKWLRRVIVTPRPFQGYFQTFAYSIWKRDHAGLPSLEPVTEIEVKSQISRPTRHEKVAAKSSCRVFGAAWAGQAQVAKVEISADGGKTWAPAKLGEKSEPFAWRFFDYVWQTPDRPTDVVLMARATDDRGRVQPMVRDDDRRDAVINHVQPIEVLVR